MVVFIVVMGIMVGIVFGFIGVVYVVKGILLKCWLFIGWVVLVGYVSIIGVGLVVMKCDLDFGV